MNTAKQNAIMIDEHTIEEMRAFVLSQSGLIAKLINRSREIYEDVFSQTIKPVTEGQVAAFTEKLFTKSGTALNLAVLLKLSLNIQADVDRWDIIVDEILGVAIAEMVVTGEPERTWSKATFFLIDVLVKKEINEVFPSEEIAVDDAIAGLAAGYQVALPGWE